MIWRTSASRPSTGSIFLAASQIGEIRGELIERRGFGIGRDRAAIAAGLAAAPLGCERATSASSAVPEVSAGRSFSNCSAGIFANSAELDRTRPERFRSPSSVART